MLSPDDLGKRVREHMSRESAGEGAIGTAGSLQRLCKAVARVIPATGAAVSLITETGTTGIVASSDERTAGLEELQFTLGESTGWDAFDTRRPVLVTDLSQQPGHRWPGYTLEAVGQGVGSVFAIPLLSGASRLGVLDIYRDDPRELDEQCLALAISFSSVATAELLDGQERAGQDSTPLGLDGALGSQSAMYQAQGMVKVQLGVGLDEAMSRMRAPMN